MAKERKEPSKLQRLFAQDQLVSGEGGPVPRPQSAAKSRRGRQARGVFVERAGIMYTDGSLIIPIIAERNVSAC
jgi:hypothetical protein